MSNNKPIAEATMTYSPRRKDSTPASFHARGSLGKALVTYTPTHEPALNLKARLNNVSLLSDQGEVLLGQVVVVGPHVLHPDAQQWLVRADQ